MNASLDYRNDFLCVLTEFETSEGLVREWYPVRNADQTEVQILCGRPVTKISSPEGVYVDEEGNIFQLADNGETKPIEVEHLSGTEKTELEVVLEASLNGRKMHKRNGDSKRRQLKNRNNGRKRQAMQMNGSAPQSLTPETTASAQPIADAANGTASEAPVQLNLRQKLAEVRRRIGYVQKRGHNERHNYSYVTAADIAGAVGDILAELGVVVVPRLESIAHEPAQTGRTDGEHLTHVVMSYSFVDVDTAEEITVKVAGEGVDAGDKAPYKAMTGALKYALLQSFLLATGDDPEDDRLDAHFTATNSERLISGDKVRELQSLIDDTGTDLERVLAYYKVAALGELTETAYRRAIEVLNRKLAKRANQETVHAQD